VTIFDYGAGNLHSLAKALTVPGVEVTVEPDPRAALDTDALILPGVGAFTPAAERLGDAVNDMRDRILNGLPTLGICLGMQLLFDRSDEGPGAGLGVVPGRVRKLTAERVPHIGWNTVEPVGEMAIEPPSIAYFANSYVCEPEDDRMVVAYTTHEQDRFASMVKIARAIGVQFHPEKSSAPGLAFVRGFVRSCVRGVAQ
jgi:glutamine amidotransferase